MSKFTKGDKVVWRVSGLTYTVVIAELDSIGEVVALHENGFYMTLMESDLTLVPDTVMVEILRSTVKIVANSHRMPLDARWQGEFKEACRAALEKEQG